MKKTFPLLLLISFLLISLASCNKHFDAGDGTQIPTEQLLPGDWYFSEERIDIDCYPPAIKKTLVEYYSKIYNIDQAQILNLNLGTDRYKLSYQRQGAMEKPYESQGTYSYGSKSLTFKRDADPSDPSAEKPKAVTIELFSLTANTMIVRENIVDEIRAELLDDDTWLKIGVEKPKGFSLYQMAKGVILKRGKM